MTITKLSMKGVALALSLLAISSNLAALDFSECHRDHDHHRDHSDRSRDRNVGVEPAQAIYQDTSLHAVIADWPIPFFVKGFRENVKVNCDGSVYEIKVPGLYSIDSFLIVNVPSIGDVVGGYITINERKLLPFYSNQESTTSTLVEFHFNDRQVYLKKGDRVSVVLSEFIPGTTISSRGFVLVALNNSRN